MKNVEIATYPVLRQLMGKYKMNARHISEIIEKSHRQTINKLNKTKTKKGKSLTFDIVEAAKITAFFKKKGEVIVEKIAKDDGTESFVKRAICMDDIFFGTEFSNENISA